MNPLHAVVKNGRLTLDAPSTLPDGQVVVLLPLDELMTLVDENGEEGVASDDGMITFSYGSPFAAPEREWKKPKAVTAAALLDELKSL